jgi:8-oxo-dGTP pyrophosphatase MutT (NUDIX family)
MAEGKVLLIQNWHGPGKWGLPGGGIHKGEEPALSATRELMEETGIALGKDQLRHIVTMPYRENGLQFSCVYFVAELDQAIAADPKLPEVLDAKWVDVRSLSDVQLGTDAHTALSLTGVVQ